MKRIILLIALIGIGVSSFAQNSTLAKGKKLNIPFSEASMKGGADLVTNGSFVTGDLTDWTDTGADWSVVSYKAVTTGSASSSLYQDVGLTATKYYSLSFDWEQTSGSGTLQVREYDGVDYIELVFITNGGAGSGTAKAIFASVSSNDILYLRSYNSWAGNIDNIVIRELNQSTTDLADNSTITANNIYPTQGVRGNGQKWFSFDGTDDIITIDDAVSVQNVFDNGGNVIMNIVTGSGDAEDSDEYLINKGVVWNLYLRKISGYYGLRLTYQFSGTDLYYRYEASNTIVYGSSYVISLAYDNSDVSNVPVLKLNGSTISSTDATAPTGTRTTDVGSDLIIGNKSTTDRTFGGNISDTYLFNYAVPSDSITSWSTKIDEGTFHLPFEDQGADNSELITNGTFTGSSTGWTEGTGWAYGTNNEACAANGSQGNLSSTAFSTTTVGKTYRLNYEIVANTLTGTGNFRMVGGAPSNIIVSDQNLTHTVGSYEIDIVSSNAGTILRMNLTSGYTGGTLTIDNIYLTELGSTLSLSPEGIYSTAWNDYYHLESYAVSGPTREEYGKHTALRFNGSDSYLMKADADFDGTGGMVIAGWMNAASLGEGNSGKIIVLDDLFVELTAPNKLRFYSDGSSVYSDNNSIELNEWTFFVVSLTGAGVTNFYIGDKDTSPVLSGGADQATSPLLYAGDLYIGNRAAGDRAFNGTLDFNIWYLDKINMPIEDFVQLLWQSTK